MKSAREAARRTSALGLACFLLALTAMISAPRPAAALPSFARQTGLACGSCHTDFPQLTPFGRRFKLGGYTMGGGNKTAEYKKTFGSDRWVPPVSFMGIAGFTDQSTLGDKDVHAEGHYSGFYGGAITDHIGAFAQVTYDAPGNLLHHFHWDNLDVRYANTTQIGKTPVTFGVTLHNNPTVQDVWNTVPAWSFPGGFVTSGLANTPAASTLIEGAFSQRVIGVGGYAFVNDMFYFEVTGYKGISTSALDKLGLDPTEQASYGTIDHFVPYFRVAAEPHWGDHSLEIGAFGMFTDTNPQGLSPGIYLNPILVANGATPLGFTIPGTDKYDDLGFDTQYQYITDAFRVTARATYIHERQRLDSTFANLASSNPTNTLNSLKANVSLGFGVDNRVTLTGGYFNTWGSTDTLLYNSSANGSPNSNGWIAEVAYMPFATTHSPIWPWASTRIGLQYVWYNKFNGSSTNYDNAGTNASDNNTLFAYLWVAM